MHSINSNSQFKLLVQNELLRLQNIIAVNEARATYPVSYREYVHAARSNKLLRQPSTYRMFFFGKKVQLSTH